VSDTDLEQRLRNVLGEVSRHDLQVTGLDEDLVRELGLESLAALRLLAAVEKRFDVRFPDDRLAEFRTLRQLREFIAAQPSVRKEGKVL
jgi:acyl carrier protein